MFFFRKEVESKIDRVEQSTSESFHRVKQDTQTLHQWVMYLNQMIQGVQRENQFLRSRIARLEEELRHMPASPEAIKRVVDSYYSFEPLMQRLHTAEKKIAELESQKSKILQHVAALPASLAAKMRIPQQSSHISEAPKPYLTSLQERVVRRVAKNGKEYIKDQLRHLVQQYGKVSALLLRDIVVDQQNLCSKSSFYRLLEELEKDDELGVISKGKEKLYLSKQPKIEQKPAEIP